MPKIIQKTVYEFDELNDAAKERAREWWRQGLESDDLSDATLEDATRIADILGVTFKTHDVLLMSGKTRPEPNIYWTLHVQGAGAVFEGSYYYARGCAKKIRGYAPQDTVLHSIADTLATVQKKHGYQLAAIVTCDGRYTFSSAADITVERNGEEVSREVADKVASALREFMDWIYRQLRDECDYRVSTEAVDEDLRANEYTFDIDGRRAG